MQYFLHGFQGLLVLGTSCFECRGFSLFLDASDFLRKYPWPGRAISDTFDDSTHRQGNVSKRFLGAMKIICGKTGDTDDAYDDHDYEDDRHLYDASEGSDVNRPFYWTQTLQQSFREELEKWGRLFALLEYSMC